MSPQGSSFGSSGLDSKNVHYMPSAVLDTASWYLAYFSQLPYGENIIVSFCRLGKHSEKCIHLCVAAQLHMAALRLTHPGFQAHTEIYDRGRNEYWRANGQDVWLKKKGYRWKLGCEV